MAPGSRLDELTAKYMQNPRRFFVPLANEYRLRGDRDRAIAVCREHLPAQPGHLSGHIVLGQAFFDKGDRPAAREAFLTAVAVDDENLIALRQLGDIARIDGDVREARQWYARVLEADPQNAEIEALLEEVSESLDAAAVRAPEPPRPDSPPAPTPAAFAAEFASPAWSAAEPGVIAAEIPTARPLPDVVEQVEPLDLTPPGLRAITNPLGNEAVVADATPGGDRGAALPFERLDLATLLDGADAAADQPSLPEAEPADSGMGFAYTDLDELAGPASDVPSLVEVVEPWSPVSESVEAVDEPIVVHDALFTFGDAVDAETTHPSDSADESAVTPAATDGAPLPAFLRDELDAIADVSPAPAEQAVVEYPLASQPVPDVPELTTAPADLTAAAEAAASPAPAVDEVLSRPAFGVLASLAAWRSSQAKSATPPAGVPSVAPVESSPSQGQSVPAAMPPVEPVIARVPTPPRAEPVRPAVFSIEPEENRVFDWDADPVSPAAETSEEFTTETMAALYAQQGFLDRALAVYRTLAGRHPHDTSLAAKVRDTEAAIDRKRAEAASDDLTANSLSGLSLDELTSPRLDPPSERLILDESGVGLGGGLGVDPAEHEHLSAEYAALETIEPPPIEAESWFDDAEDEIVASLDAGGDWFADAPALGAADDAIDFSVDTIAAAEAAPAGLPHEPTGVPAPVPEVDRRRAPNVPLMSVFDMPLVAAPDDGAADMLSSLTEQMVGRLPKDAPTLPVPDVLELPMQGDGGEVGGATPAPLLSFDRFFAGSGGLPRTRSDEVPAPLPPVTPVSLSPTFGGVPVVPPQVATPERTSADWTVFPAGAHAEPPSGPAMSDAPLPPAAPPSDLPAWRTTPSIVPPVSSGSYPAFLDAEPDGAEPPVRDAAPAVEPERPPSSQANPPASDFHRWLEGLS